MSLLRDVAAARRAPPRRGEAGRQALGQSDHGQVGVGRGHARHHGGVHDPQALEAAHPAGGVDDRVGVVGAAHAAAADRVVEGLDGAQGVVGIGQAGPGGEDAGQRGRGGHLEQAAAGGDGGGAVGRVEEPAHLDGRLVGRVAALEAHDAPARAGIGHLDIEVGEALASLHLARVGHHLVDAALSVHLVSPRQQALVPGARPGRRIQAEVEAVGDLGVVLHSPPHRGERRDRRDAVTGQLGRRPDPRAQQCGRGGVGPERHDDRVGRQEL